MSEYRYHVTLASLLPSIERHGLQPSRTSTFGGGYGGHTKGRIFSPDEGAVDCWWNKIRDQVEHHFEGRDIVNESVVPILLRFNEDKDDQIDELGTRDCPSGVSYFTTEGIEPGDIEVWDGRDWLSFDEINDNDVSPADIAAAYIAKDEEVWEEGEEDSWHDVDLALPSGWEGA